MTVVKVNTVDDKQLSINKSKDIGSNCESIRGIIQEYCNKSSKTGNQFNGPDVCKNVQSVKDNTNTVEGVVHEACNDTLDIELVEKENDCCTKLTETNLDRDSTTNKHEIQQLEKSSGFKKTVMRNKKSAQYSRTLSDDIEEESPENLRLKVL